MDIFRSQLCILMLCWVVSIIESQDNSFTVTTLSTSITPEQGSPQTLLCQYTITDPVQQIKVEWFIILSSGAETLLWTAENVPADKYTYNKAEEGYDRLKGSSASLQALRTGHSLQLLNVQAEDKGTYYCSVLYKKTDSTTLTDTSPHITVVVHIPPGPTLEVYGHDEAKPVTVRCSSPVTIPPLHVTLTIYSGNQTIDCSTTQAEMHVCQANVTFNREDNGAAINCRAQEAGKNTTYNARRILLDIKFSASNVIMTQRFPPAVNLGYRLNITCQTDSANPPSNILWRRRAAEIITRSDTYGISTSTHMGEYNAKYTTSTLSLIASEDHSGVQFDCIVKEQPSVTSDGSTLVLKTLYTVTIDSARDPLHVGDILTLTCETNQPAEEIEFKWTFSSTSGEEATEVSQNQTYSKDNVQSSDAGEYTCEASNDWGFGQESITVSVISDNTDEKFPGEPNALTPNKPGPGKKSENPKHSPSTSSAPDIGVIAGSIAACVVLTVFIIIIVLIVHRRKKDESKETRTQEQELGSGNMKNGDANPPNGPTAPPMIEAGYATIGEPANHTTETAKGSEQATTNAPDAAIIDNIGYASIGESSNQTKNTAEDLTLGEAADGLTAVSIADMGYSSIGDVATHAPTPVNCLGKKVQDVSHTKAEQNAGPEEKNLSPPEVEALYAKPDKMRKSKGKQNEKDGVAQEQKTPQTAAADAKGQSDAKPTVAVKPMKNPPGVGQKPRKRSTGLSPGQSEPQKSHEYDNVVPAAHQKSPPPKTSATNEGPYAVVAPPTGTGAPPRPKVKETTYSAVKPRSRNTAVDTDSD